MRVLVVTNVLPYPPHDGGKIRKFHLLAALAQRHEVTLLAAVPDPGARSQLLERLDVELRPVPWHPGRGRVEVARAVRELTEGRAFDVTHVCGVWQWPGEAALRGSRIVLDAENVESLLLRRMRDTGSTKVSDLDVAAVEALERQAFGRADRVLACSPEDARRIAGLGGDTRVEVIPNGVDLQWLAYTPPRPRRPGELLLTFTGVLTYWPNSDACAWFCHEVMPLLRRRLPGVRLRIVGRYPTTAVHALTALPDVDLVPDVPDVRPYLQEADLIVVPLRAGGGTRLKILEALACGRPVVSTSVGCEGLEVRSGEHLLVADGAEALAAAVVELADDPTRATALGRQGRALVEERYGWDRISERLLAVYASLDAGGRGPRASAC